MLTKLFQLFMSILGAFFGIQSERNRQRDFQSSSPLPFIIMGIIFAMILVLTLIFIVRQVLD
ncbi:MAG: DUF2970 domain-containing protein [Shewanella sp.]